MFEYALLALLGFQVHNCRNVRKTRPDSLHLCLDLGGF